MSIAYLLIGSLAGLIVAGICLSMGNPLWLAACHFFLMGHLAIMTMLAMLFALPRRAALPRK
ncbi:MAG: hypothetical protein ACSHWZ_15045 [Sulfitobacter sp.]